MAKETGFGKQGSNPGQDSLGFYECLCPWEIPESITSPPSYGLIAEKTRIFKPD